MVLTTERMAEIAKLAIRLQQISSCAAVTSSGETVLHHTHVDEILSALHDVTAELRANREAKPVVLNGRTVEGWMAEALLQKKVVEDLRNSSPAVPEEMKRDPDADVFDPGFINGWNACRAAMLKGRG